MDLFLQIVIGAGLLVATPVLAFGWILGIISAGAKTPTMKLILVGIPLLWLGCTGAWLYWIGGWEAVGIIGAMLLLGAFTPRRKKRVSGDGPRPVPVMPLPTPAPERPDR